LNRAQDEMRKYANKHRKSSEIKVGDIISRDIKIDFINSND